MIRLDEKQELSSIVSFTGMDEPLARECGSSNNAEPEKQLIIGVYRVLISGYWAYTICVF